MSASGKQPALDWETMHAFSVTFFIFLYRIAGFKLHTRQHFNETTGAIVTSKITKNLHKILTGRNICNVAVFRC